LQHIRCKKKFKMAGAAILNLEKCCNFKPEKVRLPVFELSEPKIGPDCVLSVSGDKYDVVGCGCLFNIVKVL